MAKSELEEKLAAWVKGLQDEGKFWCPYCKLWTTDTVHRPNHHNDLDHPDAKRAKFPEDML